MKCVGPFNLAIVVNKSIIPKSFKDKTMHSVLNFGKPKPQKSL
jgi:hypothetical protein